MGHVDSFKTALKIHLQNSFSTILILESGPCSFVPEPILREENYMTKCLRVQKSSPVSETNYIIGGENHPVAP
jgi:hypothetical protein